MTAGAVVAADLGERTQEWVGRRGRGYASGVDGYESPEFDASRRPGVNLVSRSTGRKEGRPLSEDRVIREGLCNQKRAKANASKGE